MGTILIAGEYARSNKKIQKLAQLANAAINDGHKVHVVGATLNHGNNAIEAHLGQLTDAKIHTGFRHEFGGYTDNTPTSFSELLLNSGYNDPKRTAVNLRKAVDLLRKVKPTHLVCWESPTFMMAAKLAGVDVKAINVGDHRFVAPNVTPIPPYAVADKAVGYSDLMDQVLLRQVRTAVSANFGAKVSDLGIFFSDDDLIEGWPEFDPFNRDSWRFVGLINTDSSLPPMMWDADDNRKILAYVDSDRTSASGSIVAALRDTIGDKIACVTGGTAGARAMRKRLNRDGYRLTDHVVDFNALLSDCDLLICTYDRDLLIAAAQHGVPTIVFPSKPCEATVCNNTVASSWLTVMDGDPGLFSIRSAIQAKLTCKVTTQHLLPFQQRMKHEYHGHAEQRILRHLTN